MILKISAQNYQTSSSPRNPNFVFFTSEKSQFLKGGPGIMLRLEVPSWPMVLGVQGMFGSGAAKKYATCSEVGLRITGGSENMAGLYHWLTFPVTNVSGSWVMGM